MTPKHFDDDMFVQPLVVQTGNQSIVGSAATYTLGTSVATPVVLDTGRGESLVMAITTIDLDMIGNALLQQTSVGTNFIRSYLLAQAATTEPGAADPRTIHSQEKIGEFRGTFAAGTGALMWNQSEQMRYPVPFLFVRREIFAAQNNAQLDPDSDLRTVYRLWFYLKRVKSLEVIGGLFG